MDVSDHPHTFSITYITLPRASADISDVVNVGASWFVYPKESGTPEQQKTFAINKCILLDADYSSKKTKTPDCKISSQQEQCREIIKASTKELNDYKQDLIDFSPWSWQTEKVKFKKMHWNKLVCAQKILKLFDEICIPKA